MHVNILYKFHYKCDPSLIQSIIKVMTENYFRILLNTFDAFYLNDSYLHNNISNESSNSVFIKTHKDDEDNNVFSFSYYEFLDDYQRNALQIFSQFDSRSILICNYYVIPPVASGLIYLLRVCRDLGSERILNNCLSKVYSVFHIALYTNIIERESLGYTSNLYPDEVNKINNTITNSFQNLTKSGNVNVSIKKVKKFIETKKQLYNDI